MIRSQNVNEISDRFRPDYAVEEPIQPDPGIDENGLMLVQAPCLKGCYTRADAAAIKVGAVLCPNGHSTSRLDAIMRRRS